MSEIGTLRRQEVTCTQAPKSGITARTQADDLHRPSRGGQGDPIFHQSVDGFRSDERAYVDERRSGGDEVCTCNEEGDEGVHHVPFPNCR